MFYIDITLVEVFETHCTTEYKYMLARGCDSAEVVMAVLTVSQCSRLFAAVAPVPISVQRHGLSGLF